MTGARDSSDRLKAVLFVALALTIVISLGLRLTVQGWGILAVMILFPPAAIIHSVVHLRLIGKMPWANPQYAIIILASDLFFLLTWVLQVDSGDEPGKYWIPVFSPTLATTDRHLVSTVTTIGAVSFWALLLSWIVLVVLRFQLGRKFDRKPKFARKSKPT